MKVRLARIINSLMIFIIIIFLQSHVSFSQTFTYINSQSIDYPHIGWVSNLNLIFNTVPVFVEIRNSIGRFDAFVGDWNGKILVALRNLHLQRQ